MARRKRDLHLYVLGGSVGESIVLRLPDLSWAVVDCFATSSGDPQTNATHRLLKANGVDTLEFLCLTHPHTDHFMGMSQLVRDFQVRAFWGFGGLHPPDFDLLKTFFQADAATSRLPDAKQRANEISNLFDEIRSRRIRHQAVSAKTLVYPASIDSRSVVKVWGLAPSGRHTDDYRRCLLKSTKGKQFRSALPKADHNLISSALLVEFGRTRIVLGGDVEADGWQDVLDYKPSRDLSAHAVKVSHHGSRNGYCPGLWDHFSAVGKPVAILTPYTPQSLPQNDALDHIRLRTRGIHSASVPQRASNSPSTSADPRLARINSTLAIKANARRLGVARASGYCHVVFDSEGHYRLRHHGDAGRIT